MTNHLELTRQNVRVELDAYHRELQEHGEDWDWPAREDIYAAYAPNFAIYLAVLLRLTEPE